MNQIKKRILTKLLEFVVAKKFYSFENQICMEICLWICVTGNRYGNIHEMLSESQMMLKATYQLIRCQLMPDKCQFFTYY